MRNKASGTDNQQGSLRTTRLGDPSETTRRPPTHNEIRAYIQGAAHDGTFNRYNQRVRIAQKGTAWLRILQKLLQRIGCTSWVYREGKDRDVFVLETQAKFVDFMFDPQRLNTRSERVAYIRGFFDAEGGIPRSKYSRFYIQLVQNNKRKLIVIKKLLDQLHIKTGVIHNPSKRVDPDYWRMFVRAESWKVFVQTIGSWHPRKYKILQARWKMI